MPRAPGVQLRRAVDAGEAGLDAPGLGLPAQRAARQQRHARAPGRVHDRLGIAARVGQRLVDEDRPRCRKAGDRRIAMQRAVAVADDHRIDLAEQVLDSRTNDKVAVQGLQLGHARLASTLQRRDAQVGVPAFAVEVANEVVGVAAVEADEADPGAHAMPVCT